MQIKMVNIDSIKPYPGNARINGQAVERIGNSVPPNLMRAIAEHVRTAILGGDKT